MRLVFIPQYALVFERALWAIFAPNFDRWLPHLRSVNCEATFLFGPKLASQIALGLLPTKWVAVSSSSQALSSPHKTKLAPL